MRLYELDSDFDLTKTAKKKLFPSGPTFTWDPAKKQWLNPDRSQVAADIHADLMQSVGMDPRGNKLSPGMIDKIKGAWAKSGAGIDPKASALGKVMGRVGAGIGNLIGKAVAPKPGAPSPAPKAPIPGNTGALSSNNSAQEINTWIKNLMPYYAKPGVDKSLLTKELVNFMASKKPESGEAGPELAAWKNAQTSLKSILKRAGLDNYDIQDALAKISAGETMESLQYELINSLLEELNLTFSDLDLVETIIEDNGIKRYVVEDSSLTRLKKLAGI